MDKEPIGKIIKSLSYNEYLVRVFKGNENQNFLGKFVESNNVIGIIYDIKTLNPEYGELGSGFESEERITKGLIPDFFDEKITLLNFMCTGFKENGKFIQDMPKIYPGLESHVYLMDKNELKDFHLENGELNLKYLNYTFMIKEKFSPFVLNSIFEELENIFSDKKRKIQIVKEFLYENYR